MRRFTSWVFVLVFAGCGYPELGGCVPSPANLMARWRGDMSAADETGKYHGVSSGPYTPAGRHGAAFQFDGAQAFTADPGDDLWPSASFSLEAWVKASSIQGGSAVVVQKYGCGGPRCDNSEYLFEIYDSGEPVFQYRTADMSDPLIEVASSKVLDATWHHLVGVRDVGAAQQRFYVDGRLAVWNPINGPALNPLLDQDMESDPITIGAGRTGSQTDPSDYFFRGAVDEVAIYFRALNDDEVEEIYAAPDGICPSM